MNSKELNFRIDVKLKELYDIIHHIQNGKNSTQVRTFLQAFYIEENYDEELKNFLKHRLHNHEKYIERIDEKWREYSDESGGAVPSELVCDEALVKRRIIYYESLKDSL